MNKVWIFGNEFEQTMNNVWIFFIEFEQCMNNVWIGTLFEHTTGWSKVHWYFATRLNSWLDWPILMPFEWVNRHTGWFVLRYNNAWYMTWWLQDGRKKDKMSFWFTKVLEDVQCESEFQSYPFLYVLVSSGHLPSIVIPLNKPTSMPVHPVKGY